MENEIEEEEGPGYCPSCGSCGESGCCRPDMCKVVQCHYGESNLRDYKELMNEWNIMFKALLDLGVDVDSLLTQE